jgi:5-methylcytosine-specific restriction endonuclease McrA
VAGALPGGVAVSRIPRDEITRYIDVRRHEVRVYFIDLERDYPELFYSRALGRLIRDEVARAKPRLAARRARLSRRLWDAVLDRFGHRCAYCGAAGELQQEHRIPFSKGGPSDVSNIVPACPSCNSRKRAQPPELWPLLVQPS